MANNNDDNYATLSENEDSSDGIIEVTPIPLVRKKRGRPAKTTSTNEISNQETSIALDESTGQASNPIMQTAIHPASKPQSKSSWVWDFYIKKPNEKGEMRVYCQYVDENGKKCLKHYKYDGSTGNLSYHIVNNHGIIPPAEGSSIYEIRAKSTTNKPIPNTKDQKEKEESLLRWILLTTQPLSTVTHKAYIEHMQVIDPEFIIPGEKKIRMMIARSYGYNRDKLKQFLKTAQSISLTTDLWSSRSKHGYLGLTATWINQDFEIMDVLLEISYFPSPHTAYAISDFIKKAIRKWEIESHVISVTTDNGANMVAAIRNLRPIKRLSCAAHTLQLAINKGLKLVENLVLHVKRLINFFSTQKQIERLIKVQKDIGYEEPLHLIQDVSTR